MTARARDVPAIASVLLVLAGACAPSTPPSRSEATPVASATSAHAADTPSAPAAAAPAEPGEHAVCGAGCASQPLAGPLPAGSAQTFGQPFATDPAADVDIAQVLATPDRFTAEPLTVRGEVTAVCKRRGCWLEVAPRAEAAAGAEREGCRVISEHHDWLVPRDSEGATARVRGRVEVRTIPAAQVAHMEAEGGRFANKQPDGSARELRLIASGVALLR